jgi:hypothetical protein
MADFSALCPLFSTGVKNELFIERFSVSAVSTTARILAKLPPFGRSVTVTTIYVRPTTKWPSTTAALTFKAGKATSQLVASATYTVFASLKISKTYTVNKWYAMTVTAKDFSPGNVIRFSVSSKETCKGVEVWVRYKEK